MDGICHINGRVHPQIYGQPRFQQENIFTDLLCRFLYTLALSLDANFRLKRKDRRGEDIWLGDGRAYCVADLPFNAHITSSQHAVEERDFVWLCARCESDVFL